MSGDLRTPDESLHKKAERQTWRDAANAIGCGCSDYRKPCQYHEGWDAGYEQGQIDAFAVVAEEVERRRIELRVQDPNSARPWYDGAIAALDDLLSVLRPKAEP